MTLIFSKDEPLNFTKDRPELKKITVGAGWDTATEGAKAIDVDLFGIGLGADGKGASKDVCYFGQKSIYGGAVAHSGDNLTGEGSGIDEAISVDLSGVPAEITSILFGLTIYSGQNFDDIQNEFIQIANAETGEIIAKSGVGLTGTGKTFLLAIFSRDEKDWCADAKLTYSEKEFQKFIADYGVN